MVTRFIVPILCVAFSVGCGDSTPKTPPATAAPKAPAASPQEPVEKTIAANCEPVRWCGARQDVKKIADVLKPGSLGCPPQVAGAEIPDADREVIYGELKLGAGEIAKFDEAATAKKRGEGNAIDCCYARDCDGAP